MLEVVRRRELLPLIDFAYQGFGDGLEEDAWSTRLFARELDELMSGPHVPPRTEVLSRYQPEKVIPQWLECLQEQP